MDDYQFEDITEGGSSSDAGMPASPAPAGGGQSDGGSAPMGGHGGGNRRYADEIFSKKISGKFRTFFVDLKESGNGKFFKVSEKSHGRKSTIMFDAEDLDEFITALTEAKGHL